MKFSQSFKLAIKSIMASKVRSFLTMLGIIIGVAAVIVIVGLGNGMEIYMRESFESMGTNTLNVNVFGRGSTRTVDPEDMYAFVDENRDYFNAVTPSVTVNASVKIGNETTAGTSITGVGEDNLDIASSELESGRYVQYVDILRRNNVCVVGNYIDDEYFNGNSIGQTLKLNGNTYTIVGVLAEEAESDEGTADDAIFIPYTNAMKLSMTSNVNSYVFQIASEDEVAMSKQLIETELYNVFQTEDAYYVLSMSEILDVMTEMVNVMVTLLAVIAAISLVVGGIGIMNIMLISVSERTREIGIRKALGARQIHVMTQFVIEAATTGALGGVLGILFGYALSSLGTQIIVVAMNTDMQVTPSASAVLGAFGVSVAIGIIFGYLPAKKASKLNPIDALRRE